MKLKVAVGLVTASIKCVNAKKVFTASTAVKNVVQKIAVDEVNVVTMVFVNVMSVLAETDAMNNIVLLLIALGMVYAMHRK
jgi:multisubunit Na+/H+ antiporter MnhF subunit